MMKVYTHKGEVAWVSAIAALGCNDHQARVGLPTGGIRDAQPGMAKVRFILRSCAADRSTILWVPGVLVGVGGLPLWCQSGGCESLGSVAREER